MKDFDYAPGYEPTTADSPFDREKAIQLWEDRLKQVQETGNFSNDHRNTPFFSGKSWPNQESKEEYCRRMIRRIIHEERAIAEGNSA